MGKGIAGVRKALEELLDHRSILTAARLLICTMFLVTGVAGLTHFSPFAQGMAMAGLPYPTAVATVTVLVQLLGSFLLVTDYRGLGWLGAGALGVFTFLTIPIGHPFWLFQEPRRSEEMHIALEHVTVIGGLLLAAIASRRGQRPRQG
jgi:transmembrane protein